MIAGTVTVIWWIIGTWVIIACLGIGYMVGAMTWHEKYIELQQEYLRDSQRMMAGVLRERIDRSMKDYLEAGEK